MKPRLASQMILRHLGGGSAASWRPLEGILEASWGVLEAAWGVLEALFLVLGAISGSSSIYRLSVILMINFCLIFEENTTQTYMMSDLSMQVAW